MYMYMYAMTSRHYQAFEKGKTKKGKPVASNVHVVEDDQGVNIP